MLSDNYIHLIKDGQALCGSKLATVGVHTPTNPDINCPKCRKLLNKPTGLQVPSELMNAEVGDVLPVTKHPEPCEKRKPAYGDDDKMPFGKYKGERMADVPASYLHWLWQQKPLSNLRLENYIFNNIEALKKEHKDGIW